MRGSKDAAKGRAELLRMGGKQKSPQALHAHTKDCMQGLYLPDRVEAETVAPSALNPPSSDVDNFICRMAT